MAEGGRTQLERLLELLRSGTTPGTVDLVVDSWDPARGDLTGFVER